MSPYHYLPPEQRRVQKLVTRFNADERLWRRLGRKRRRRRKLCPRMPARHRKLLDLLEFAAARPLEDCVGLLPA